MYQQNMWLQVPFYLHFLWTVRALELWFLAAHILQVLP